MTNPAEYITGRTVQEQMNELISYVDTRAAEVASAYADAAQASAEAAAASAQDAADTVSDCVKKTPSGVQTITGYGLTVSQGITADVTGDITSAGSSAFSGDVTVPTVSTGTFDTKAANGTKVKNELDNYSAMLRTTGNQTFAGTKTNETTMATTSSAASTPFITRCTNADVTAVAGNLYGFFPMIVDDNDKIIGGIRVQMTASSTIFTLWSSDTSGTRSTTTLATFDRSAGTWS